MSSVIEAKRSTTHVSVAGFAWLEITPSCQLQCVHCYRESRPGLGHGAMQLGNWKQVIASLHASGTRYLQFIGGEPTLYPHFCELVEYAAALGLHIEVYSNLVSITKQMWVLFLKARVRLATSFYTDSAMVHDAITGVTGSYYKTLANIKKALALSLTLRVGMVHIRADQNIHRAKALLSEMGVKKIGVDRARGVGRGVQLRDEEPLSALCGKCTNNKSVITADGTVYNCIMSRAFPVGNVLKEDIAVILAGSVMQETTAMLRSAFAARTSMRDCDPDDPLDCDPECDPGVFPPCGPDCCPETVADCEPSEE